MANVFTALAPTLYSAAQEVSAEPFGAVDSINTNFDDKGVAIGDSVIVPVAPTRAAGDYTPAMTTTAGTDATATSVTVTITKNRAVSWNLSGEQIRSLQNGGNYQEWVRQLVAQGMRKSPKRMQHGCRRRQAVVHGGGGAPAPDASSLQQRSVCGLRPHSPRS